MTSRVITAATITISLAALIARAVALALTDIDRGLRDFRVDPVPAVIPEWVQEEADL